MVRRIYPLIALLLFSFLLPHISFSQDSEAFDYLQNRKITVFEWGLNKFDIALKKEFRNRAGSTEMILSTNKIGINIKLRDTVFRSSQEAKNQAISIVKDIKIFLEIDPVTHTPVSRYGHSRIGKFFCPSPGDCPPDRILKELDESTYINVSLGVEGNASYYECKNRLLSKKMHCSFELGWEKKLSD